MQSTNNQSAPVAPINAITQHLFSIGIVVPSSLRAHMRSKIQLPRPHGEVNLRREGRPAVQTIESLLRRFASYPHLCPAVIQVCERQIRQGRHVCNIPQAMDDLSRLHAWAQPAEGEIDAFERDAYMTVISMVYLMTMDRTACRYLMGMELQRLVGPMRELYQHQQCPALLKPVIIKIEARLGRLSPVVFTPTEQASLTVHDRGNDVTQSAKDLVENLLLLLIDEDSVDDRQEILWMEEVDSMVSSSNSLFYKIMVLSLAATIRPRRSFRLAESYILPRVLHEQQVQWQLDGVLGAELRLPGDDGAAYLVELPRVDKEGLLDGQIAGISTDDFAFTSAQAAKRFLYEPRIKIQLGRGVDDDLHVIGENRPYAVKELMRAMMSKCKVTTDADDFSTRDAKDDRTKEEMIVRFEGQLARSAPDFNRQFLAAKAEAAVDCLIKLHTEGLGLHWIHLPKGAKDDIRLTATQRFEALLQLCTDIKAIPTDWISEGGADVGAPAVVAPRKCYSMKLAGARSNKKKKETVDEAKAAAEELARTKEKEKEKGQEEHGRDE
ncbi:hypothetical protein CLAFUW4_12577 [Fulvia fulva]|uniref:Uncharacterized protein n=1 Tax=Passalora fulva TaxID=5499 RepID=A0A9Q8PDY0_PASFU|nr:uncharacterized protein CLAFUR5_11602 [Fulvia fulva]KAK4618149.1 hypothetical protein CLAFUR4_12582 [Fulvia fulva]KAK4618931.1 hypothetical protein CLAFUR0_12593 [Fulvia fulva]UJO20703.1 hypothetical protein CLAFUR5_11602 [Fulvia fulva]WPV18574.1 hypothetical protein CLAFUW4_12577 [Fulvia fulva]WPV33059.1 hypothetical protein CLAFUW7_12584 [Fulvia fulva]